MVDAGESNPVRDTFVASKPYNAQGKMTVVIENDFRYMSLLLSFQQVSWDDNHADHH